MTVQSTCQLCGAAVVMQRQAGGMWYQAFEPDTEQRHVCPVVEAERAALARSLPGGGRKAGPQGASRQKGQCRYGGKVTGNGSFKNGT